MPVPMRKERLQAKKAPDRRSDEIMRLPRGCEGECDRRAEKRIVAVLTMVSRHPPATERQRSTATLPELLSNVVFVKAESGGVLQDSVGEDSTLDHEGELMASVEASPAASR